MLYLIRETEFKWKTSKLSVDSAMRNICSHHSQTNGKGCYKSKIWNSTAITPECCLHSNPNTQDLLGGEKLIAN